MQRSDVIHVLRGSAVTTMDTWKSIMQTGNCVMIIVTVNKNIPHSLFRQNYM
jgi:hypothetical protein